MILLQEKGEIVSKFNIVERRGDDSNRHIVEELKSQLDLEARRLKKVKRRIPHCSLLSSGFYVKL